MVLPRIRAELTAPKNTTCSHNPRAMEERHWEKSVFSMTNCWCRRQPVGISWLEKTLQSTPSINAFFFTTHTVLTSSRSLVFCKICLLRDATFLLCCWAAPSLSGRSSAESSDCWKNSNSLLDLTKLLSASSEALEISKWDTPMIFFIKNCVPLSKRITYLFTSHQNKEAAEQLNYIPKFTNKVSKKTQVSWDRWKILQCTRRQTFFFLHQHDGLIW